MFRGTNPHWQCVVGPIVFVKQYDSHSCGPIATLKIMSLFGAIPTGTMPEVLEASDRRRITMDNYRGLVQHFQQNVMDGLSVRVSGKREKDTRVNRT
jgi:hypothetical protein